MAYSMERSPTAYPGMSVSRKIKFLRTVGSSHDYLFKVVMVGDSGTGKSALCHRFSHDAYNPSYIATIGVDFQVASFTLPDGKVAKQQLWDTAGQERFRSITRAYYRNTNGIVIVYDCTDRRSANNVFDLWIREARALAGEEASIVVVGNKVDMLPHCADARDTVAFATAQCKELGVSHITASAKTADCVDDCFLELADLMRKQRGMRVGMTRDSAPGLSTTLEGETIGSSTPLFSRFFSCCTL